MHLLCQQPAWQVLTQIGPLQYVVGTYEHAAKLDTVFMTSGFAIHILNHVPDGYMDSCQDNTCVPNYAIPHVWCECRC